MIIRPDPAAAAAANVASSTVAPTECGNCGSTDHPFLHSVRYSSAYRRVCTSCVLRLHPQHFCPTCFTVYPSVPPPLSAEYQPCSKCYSFSHIHCLGSADQTPYTCPLCANPNSSFFVLKKAKDFANDGEDVTDGEYRVMERKDAKILLAAAKIASTLMTKNAAEAHANAEKRAREAAASRKRAREALDHLAHLVAKENFKKKEAALAAGIQGPGSCGSLVVWKGPYVDAAGSLSMNQTVRGVPGNANNGVAGNGNNGVAGRFNGSNEALPALAAVNLGDGERRNVGVLNVNNLQIGLRLNDLVPMDVDVNRALISQEDPHPPNVIVGHSGSVLESISQVEVSNGLVGHGVSAVELPGSFVDNVQNHGGEEDGVSNTQVIDVPMENHLEVNDNHTQARTDA